LALVDLEGAAGVEDIGISPQRPEQSFQNAVGVKSHLSLPPLRSEYPRHFKMLGDIRKGLMFGANSNIIVSKQDLAITLKADQYSGAAKNNINVPLWV
jgi:hypothetical protein